MITTSGGYHRQPTPHPLSAAPLGALMDSNSSKPDAAGSVPQIAPVPAGVERPLWSVMIPTFNCAKYLRETLESVLSQDPGPERMQIEVVDDCSDKDDPETVVRETGRGRVTFHRKPMNEGAVWNFNTCIERSRGHLIHVLNGDDLVEPGFYREFSAAFEASAECAAVFCRAFDIDGSRDLVGLSEFCQNLKEGSNDARELLMGNLIRSPAAVVRRSFYERYGGFDTSLVYTHDWDVWVRATVNSRARMLNRPLASYRTFDGNFSSRVRRSAEQFRDFLRFSEKRGAEGLTGFDRTAFNSNLVRWSFAEARHFQRLGDDEAARANYAFFRESSTLRQRGYIYLELFLRQLHSLLFASV
jgi:glycosyltransferase involved in cell wall biosynthesis